MLYSCISLFSLLGVAAGASAGWNLVQNGTTGLVALEVIVVSPTLAVMFDKATNDPLMINGHTTWGALWDMETNTASPLAVVSDSFCASGGFLSNGTMVRCVLMQGLMTLIVNQVSVAGNIPLNPLAYDGRMGIRLFDPCANPSGAGCTLFEDPQNLHLVENRWYTTAIRIFDGSLVCPDC